MSCPPLPSLKLYNEKKIVLHFHIKKHMSIGMNQSKDLNFKG